VRLRRPKRFASPQRLPDDGAHFGLDRKAWSGNRKAPVFNASTALSTVPWAVIMTTGNSSSSSRRAGGARAPCRRASAMRRSVITRSRVIFLEDEQRLLAVLRGVHVVAVAFELRAQDAPANWASSSTTRICLRSGSIDNGIRVGVALTARDRLGPAASVAKRRPHRLRGGARGFSQGGGGAKPKRARGAAVPRQLGARRPSTAHARRRGHTPRKEWNSRELIDANMSRICERHKARVTRSTP